jgi:FkbM family methyltransferase
MSANREDITIFNAFFNQPEFWNSNHTYMEIGAHDGLRESNSRFFDLCLRWQGLLVEAHPLNYERLVVHRPNSHHINVAPSCTKDATGTISFATHTFTNAAVLPEGRSGLKVHCGPLQHYLDALDMKHVNFWSLDVEGSEYNILKTVDFDRTRIDVVIVESQNSMSGRPEYKKKVADVRAYMLQSGYLMLRSVKIYKSDVFLHTDACYRYDFPECKQHNT